MIGIQQLHLRELCFGYQNQLVFDQFNLQVEAGQVVQLVGRNGAGKTTLLKILAGILIPETYALWVNGKISKTTVASYQQQVRYVGHAVALKWGLTLYENLQYDSLIFHQPLPSALPEWLDNWGLASVQDRVAGQLSFGQQRKVALLRLLCFPGTLWLLDEPGVAIDMTTSKLFMRLLHDHVQNRGIVILSTHQPIVTHSFNSILTITL